MKIIGITGPKNSGKDTSADFLKELGKSNGKISFAGPLKEICSIVFDIAPEVFEDRTLKEEPFNTPFALTSRMLRNVKKEMVKMLDPVKYAFSVEKASINGLEHVVMHSPREILQFIGTNFIRTRIDPEWHVKASFSDERLARVGDGVFCVTDVRFVNEYQYLANKFGDDFTGLYISRPCAEEDLKSATHPSELQVVEVKKLIPDGNIIKNDGSLEDLKKTLNTLKLDKALTSKGTVRTSKFKFSLKK